MKTLFVSAALWIGVPLTPLAPPALKPGAVPPPMAGSAVVGLAAPAPVAPLAPLAPAIVPAAIQAAVQASAAKPGDAPSADPIGDAFDGRLKSLDAEFAGLHAAVRAGQAGPLPDAVSAPRYLFVGGMFANRTKDYFGANMRRLDALGVESYPVKLDTQGRRRAGLRAIEAAVRRSPVPVVLVGHSRGGVLAHDWYRRASPALKAKVERLVLIQAPITGTPYADHALIGRWNRFKLRVLGPLLFGSNLFRTVAEMTLGMRSHVLSILPAWAPGDLEKVYTLSTSISSLRGFYEKRRKALEKLGVPDSDGLVPAAASRIDGARNVLLRDVEHKHTVIQKPGWVKRLQGYRPHPGYDAGDLTEAFVRLLYR